MPDLDGLPAADRVRQGLSDLAKGQRTLESLWLRLAARRLRTLGLPIPEAASGDPEPELALYEVVGRRSDDPHYAYNALRRELDSFISALEQRARRDGAASGAS